jgi:hypothetical protein
MVVSPYAGTDVHIGDPDVMVEQPPSVGVVPTEGGCFGAPAQNCTQPCAHRQQGKLAEQASTAEIVCTTITGRLFITDKCTKHRFLIDTGSSICVFPRALISQGKDSVHYELRAPNGSTIPTYGWLHLSVNLGLSQDFTWRFAVADVTYPLIGADFLSHFGILVDCRNNRLLDGITLMSASPQPMDRLRPVLTEHSPDTFADKDLRDCTHVFLRQDARRRATEPPYSGPYQVLSRRRKTLQLLVSGKPITVSTRRVKPAYVFNEADCGNISFNPAANATLATSTPPPAIQTTR